LYIDGETNGRSANKSTSHNYKLNVWTFWKTKLN
jgi:hypothetical protein